MFDVIAEPHNFTVAQYRQAVHKKMEEIWQRKAVPVVVGGSLFYLKALLFAASDIQKKEGSVETMPLDVSHATNEELWNKLYAIDPARAEKINKNDTYRIQRALHIWYQSGVKPSEYTEKFQPIAPCHITFVTRDRPQLYERIDQRVMQMLDQGWVAEVEALSPAWRSFLLHKKLLGYPEIIEMLEQGDSLHKNDVYALIQQKTRNYAKRQITFWRSLRESIEKQHDARVQCDELNLTLSSVDLYLNHIQSIIQERMQER